MKFWQTELQLLSFPDSNPQTTTNCFSFCLVVDNRAELLDALQFYSCYPYLENWCFTPWDERLTLAQLAAGEKEGKGKSQMERSEKEQSNSWVVRRILCLMCVETAVWEQFSLLEHTLFNQKSFTSLCVSMKDVAYTVARVTEHVWKEVFVQWITKRWVYISSSSLCIVYVLNSCLQKACT